MTPHQLDPTLSLPALIIGRIGLAGLAVTMFKVFKVKI